MSLPLTWVAMGSAQAQPTRLDLCYPSGLRVGIRERRGRPLIGVATVFGGGSSTERHDERGAAPRITQ